MDDGQRAVGVRRAGSVRSGGDLEQAAAAEGMAAARLDGGLEPVQADRAAQLVLQGLRLGRHAARDAMFGAAGQPAPLTSRCGATRSNTCRATNEESTPPRALGACFNFLAPHHSL
eukprot:COSAG04_NODE_6882_length_1234_cov_2.071366_2_plen_116_part_00